MIKIIRVTRAILQECSLLAAKNQRQSEMGLY